MQNEYWRIKRTVIWLTNKPQTGTQLGNDTDKIRLAIKSKGKGKSGVWSYLKVVFR
jgi:hypothetical protein